MEYSNVVEEAVFASHIAPGNIVRVYRGPYRSRQGLVREKTDDELVLFDEITRESVGCMSIF